MANKALATMEKFCEMGNPNAVHMLLLLKAERKATQKTKDLDVRRAYDEAIRATGREGVLILQAFANERAGVYYLNSVRDKNWAATYLSRAHDLYMNWGAAGKARHMETTYESELIKPSSAFG